MSLPTPKQNKQRTVTDRPQGFTMDRFGRKKTVQIGALIAAIGAILQCAAANLGMMLAGRIISGWAVGLMSMSVPVYQAECAPPKIRGLIVGLTQQMIGVGFIVSTWIGYGSGHAPATSSVQWRFPLAFQALPSLVLLGGLFLLPESPVRSSIYIYRPPADSIIALAHRKGPKRRSPDSPEKTPL